MEDAFPARPRRANGFGWSIPAASLLSLIVLVFGSSGCSNYIGTTAASYLRRVKNDPDPNVRYLAYSKLAQPDCYETPEQKAEAVKTLIAKLERGKEPVATRAVI